MIGKGMAVHEQRCVLTHVREVMLDTETCFLPIFIAH